VLVGQGDLDRVDDVNVESARLAPEAEHFNVAGSPFAKVEVGPFHERARCVPCDHLIDEGLGRLRELPRGWLQPHDFIGTCLAQMGLALFEGTQACGNVLRTEQHKGVGVEGQGDDLATKRRGGLTRAAYQCDVPEVHAVKVADCQDIRASSHSHAPDVRQTVGVLPVARVCSCRDRILSYALAMRSERDHPKAASERRGEPPVVDRHAPRSDKATKSLPSPRIAELLARVDGCMIADRHRLHGRLRSLERASPDRLPLELDRLAQDLERSEGRAGERRKRLPVPTYPPELPVSQLKDDIRDLIRDHQVVVVCGETGSGKTTQLPKICLELGRGVHGLIAHTQPRRLAARTVAQRIADELNTPLGEGVGYKIRFGDKTSPRTFVKLMTDGILLAETQGDRYLEQYDTIIIDEAHERSLNIDFLMGYLKQLLPKRPELKVIITSATIDTERFSKHFSGPKGPAPIIEVSGRTYPVELLYRPRQGMLEESDEREGPEDLADAVVRGVDEACTLGNGDILVFLSGEREIRECTEALRKHHLPGSMPTTVLPLYSRLSNEEQNRVFQPHSGRRVVLATNVAETSLTVPGIRYVIDPGDARIKRYAPRNRVHRLEIEAISKASARQRAGRCGRVGPGVCIRLYTEEDFKSRPEFTDPEILRTNLASVILQMKALDLGDVERFPFVEPPDSRQIKDGYETLRELGAVDEQYRITEIGRRLARLPVDPRLGRMILAGHKEDCLDDVLVIAAALSVQDPRDRRLEIQQAADAAHALYRDENSDFITLLNIWEWYEHLRKDLSRSKLVKACKQRYLSWLRMREWEEVYHQLHTLLSEMGLHPHSKKTDHDAIHRALVTGLLTTVGMKNPNPGMDSTPGEYLGTFSSKFHIFPGSVLHKVRPKWIMSAEIVRTTKNYARTNAAITPKMVEDAAQHLVQRTHTNPHWDVDTQRVMAMERVLLFGLEIASGRRVNYGPINPVQARELFIHHALVEGEFKTDAKFFRHNQQLVKEVEKLEEKSRRRDILVDIQQRHSFYEKRIPPDVHDQNTFDKWYRTSFQQNPGLLFMSREDLMLHDAASVTAQQFPDALQVSGSRLKIEYVHDHARTDDGVAMTIPLEALNQVDEKRSEWLVPGLLVEKIEAMLKSIPKSARRHIGPAREAAELVASKVPFGEGDLREAIHRVLDNATNVETPRSLWDAAAAPDHLKMFFRVIDEKGKTLASGRDLAKIRRDLGAKVEDSFSKIGGDALHRDGLREWSFGDLPERIDIRRGGMTVFVYPAVLDQNNAVGTRIVETLARAKELTHAGVRRLFLIKAGREIKHRVAARSGVERMCAQYATLGSASDLLADVHALVAERAFMANLPDVRSKEAFDARVEARWEKITQAVDEVSREAEQIIAEYQKVRLVLDVNYAAPFAPALADMRDQLAHLVFKGFLATIPAEHRQHLPRYLAGIRVRMGKVAANLPRDSKLMEETVPYWRAAKARVELHAKAGVTDGELTLYRWMVEEFRVAQFAQELRTAMTVSPKRLQEQWNRIGKP